MIAYIKGIIDDYYEDHIIIDNNGMGYSVYMSVTEIEKIKNIKDVVKVYTYQYVREDAMGLYGFLDKEALNMFKLLIGVSGVGPKAGISMLSSISPSNIVLAIITNDDKTLCKAQGIGKKTAQRIILELKDKFKNYDATLSANKDDYASNSDSFEALGALMSLGYTKQEATDALSKVDKNISIEDMVKQGLKSLMRG